jgi:hypothetical protein
MASIHEPLLVGGAALPPSADDLSPGVSAQMARGPVPREGPGTRTSGWFPPGKAGALEAYARQPRPNPTQRENRYRPYYDANRPLAVPPVSGYARWAPVTGVYAGFDGHISSTDADRRAWMARTQMAHVPDDARVTELFRDPYGELARAYPQNRAPRAAPPSPHRDPDAPLQLMGGGAVQNPGGAAATMAPAAGDPTAALTGPALAPREDLSSHWEALKIVPGNISGNYVVADASAPAPAAHVIDLSSDDEAGETARVVPAPTAQTVEGAAAAAPLDMLPGAPPSTQPPPPPPAAPALGGGALPDAPAPGLEPASQLLGGSGKRKRRPRAPGGKADRRNALVGKLMREHGLSLAAASKRVKDEHLEY